MTGVRNTDIVETEVKTEETKPEELVSKSVLEDFKKDMFKYKEKARNTEMELQKLRDEKVLMEKSSLEEKEEWKLLYEREKEEKANALSDLQSKSEFFMDSSKKNAVVQRIGGFKKDSYTKFIDTSRIDVRDDGTFDEESIVREADRLKQEFPELLKASPLPGKMPNEAASNMSAPQEKNLNNMSMDELLAQYTMAKKNNK